MKERIYSFDLIRAICAWIIVINHYGFSCMMSPTYANLEPVVYHANGSWGEITVVAVFFMISGASLYYNHKQVTFHDLPKFYWSRFKGIFPMFYMLWLFLYYQKVLDHQSFFYTGSVKSLILTLFGMDGYFAYKFPTNYYIIGEWFLGGLIFLYILYPLLALGMRKCRWVVTAIIALAFASLYFTHYFVITEDRNLIVCIANMWIGMLFMEYREFFSKTIFAIIFGVLALIFVFVAVPIPNTITMMIMAFGILLVLNKIAAAVMRPAPIGRFISWTASLSYPIFLLQHIVMDQVLSIYQGRELGHFEEFLLLILTFVLIYIFSVVLVILNKHLVNSKPFKWIGEKVSK
ncbi:MAG: acyltransferase [Lachnospiraceae bacterium]|nr:acyltransferase [Lachnospiraceae bacterium]